jgi:hypothetical protein
MLALHNLRNNNDNNDDDCAHQSRRPISLQGQFSPSSRYTPSSMRLTARRVAVVLLLACGGALWLAIGNEMQRRPTAATTR